MVFSSHNLFFFLTKQKRPQQAKNIYFYRLSKKKRKAFNMQATPFYLYLSNILIYQQNAVKFNVNYKLEIVKVYILC